ncbi:MAG: diguanylate cyclase [Cyanobium sp.]|jgi:diguanylate cyclase (GGDEF)-like protein/PAS domain S-box-containing protein
MHDQTATRRLSLDQMPVALALVDRQLCFSAVNRRWLQVLQQREEELLSRPWGDLFPDMAATWRDRQLRALRGETITIEREQWRDRDGRSHWLRWELCPWNEQQERLGLMVRVDAIRSRRGDAEFAAVPEPTPTGLVPEQARELEASIRQLQRSLRDSWRQCRQLQHQASRDALTGLFNRRFLDNILLRELTRPSGAGDVPTGLVMIDVDQFKQLNDQYGHLAGDAVLRQTAQIIRATMRRSDIACRYGGDEFTLILPHTDLASARLAAETLQQRLTGIPESISEWSLPRIRFSFGVAALPGLPAATCHPLLAADQALYQAKRAGGDRICTAERPTSLDPQGKLLPLRPEG